MGRYGRRFAPTVVLGVAVFASGCSSTPLPQSNLDRITTVPAEPDLPQIPVDTSLPDVAVDDPPAVDFTIDLERRPHPLNPRLFGTNVPAWLGPERLVDPEFIMQTVASGATLLRMPGGSWSNVYNWLACEIEDPNQCLSTSAAKPTEFIDFLQATDLPGMWTVSINESAQSAAAAVAFFNGDVGDTSVIGVDRYSVDWGTVGRWAQLRSDRGNPDPVDIHLWEVGNEVYGARPETGGADCPGFGWEEVWTCDGREYVLGDAEHDGYLAFRSAMLAVDSTIQVGAVGVSEPGAWGNWGNEVIEATGDALDFYIVHQYGFESSPDGDDALERPARLWPDLIDGLQDVLGEIPIVISEYNLVSNESRDTAHAMTRTMNALYLADSIGQFASNDVAVANVWNLANGTTNSGTDYGLVSVEDGHHFPAFDALRLWSRAGSQLLDVGVRRRVSDVHMYPTRHEDGRMTLIVVNLGEAVTANVGLDGFFGSVTVEMSGVFTDDLAATALIEQALSRLTMADGMFLADFPGWSISVIEIEKIQADG